MVKKILSTLFFCIVMALSAFAQCFQQLSTASNIYSIVVNRTNQLAVNNDLNTLVFIHRNDHTVFGGHSGQLRYDISTNGGTTWTSNQGVLNPLADATLSGARYPQVVIHNPVGNTVPNNAHLVYRAPAVNSGAWGNSVGGVRKLDGTGNTENYYSSVTQQIIPANLCKGAPGIYWTIDAVYNGSAYTGFRIWKGTWTGSDVSWAVNYTYNSGLVNNAGVINLADWSIAFDPTGNIGWALLVSHATNGPSYSQYHPVLYKTTDAGANWSGPISVNYDSLKVVRDALPANSYPANFFEADIAVDIYGNPHILTQVNNGPGTGYSVYPSGQKLYDITHNGTNWEANFVADLTAHRGMYSINNVTHDNRPQVSMTDDGTKIFFTWVDSDPPVTGTTNSQPNLFARGYDVVSKNWTCSKKNATVCSSAFNNKMHSHTVSPNILMSNNNYIVPYVSAQLNATSQSDLDPASFQFSKELSFSNADFNKSATVALSGPKTICTGSSLVLTAPNATSYTWNNTMTTNSISVSYADTFYVTLGTGACKLISNPIVTSVAPNPQVPSITPNGPTSFCTGDSVKLTASAANNYLWPNGDTTQFIYGSMAGQYSVTVANSFGCTSTSAPLTVNLYNLPTPPQISITGNSSFCAGDSATLNSSYSNNNLWSTGNSTANLKVFQAGSYTVTYTDNNGCKSTSNPYTIVLYPNPPVPVITTSGSFNFCDGDSVLLSSTTANSYSWSNGSNNQSIWVNQQGVHKVVVTNSDGCSNVSLPVTTQVFSLPAPPIISISGSPKFCEGGSALLASDYGFGNTWSNNEQSQTISVSQTGTYFVIHEDINGCTSISDTVQITVFSNPATPLASYQNGVLSTPVLGGQYYFQWYNDNGIIVGAGSNEYVPPANGLYYVSVTDSNGCSSFSLNVLVMNVGVEEYLNNKVVKIFPNPFTNTFNIVTLTVIEDIRIMNTLGETVYYNKNLSKASNLQIDLGNHSSGLYLVQIRTNKQTETFRVVKQ